MSNWYQVKEQDDMERSSDGKTLDVYFLEDHNGGNYVEIPIEFIKKAINVPQWTTKKPDFACIFVSKKQYVHNNKKEYDYRLWMFAWELAEQTDDNRLSLYLTWQEASGGEWDDIDECDFDEYLILELLPTEEETNKQIIEDRIKRGIL